MLQIHTVGDGRGWRKRLAHVTFVLVENDGKSNELVPGFIERGPNHPGTQIPQYVEYMPEYFVAKTIARLRNERGWTQTALGERLAKHGHDLHQTTIAKLEAGKRPIRVNEVYAFADVLGVPVTDLLPDMNGMVVNQDELAVLVREIAALAGDLRDDEDTAQALQMQATAAQAQLATILEAVARKRERLRELQMKLAEDRRGD